MTLLQPRSILSLKRLQMFWPVIVAGLVYDTNKNYARVTAMALSPAANWIKQEIQVQEAVSEQNII